MRKCARPIIAFSSALCCPTAWLRRTGAIGGSASHEFMVLAETGESEIVYCDRCEYAANVEKAVCSPVAVEKRQNPGLMAK